jgi:hypothetical protein
MLFVHKVEELCDVGGVQETKVGLQDCFRSWLKETLYFNISLDHHDVRLTFDHSFAK